MAQNPFSTGALAENRAGRLTAEQIRDLRADAGASKRSGLTAGVAVTALGLVILWGTLAGRVPGPRLQSLAVGAALAIAGGLLLASGGMTRGPRAAQAASESTVLERVEGPFRRERYDPQVLGGHSYATRGDARYDYFLHVGGRRIRVSQAVHDASPEDGIVRVYLLPGSDRVVNLERIGDPPPTPLEARAAAVLSERFGASSPGEAAPPPGATPASPAALREALLGRWQAQGLPMRFEFRADGTVLGGAGSESEVKRWEVLDAARIRIDGEEQRVEVSGDVLRLVTGGPTFRFDRVRS